jgi:hypothetical protein
MHLTLAACGVFASALTPDGRGAIPKNDNRSSGIRATFIGLALHPKLIEIPIELKFAEAENCASHHWT